MILLQINPQRILQCRNQITKIILILIGVFISYSSTVDVIPVLKEIVKTEENIQVKIEGLTTGKNDSVGIYAKIIKICFTKSITHI